MTIHTYHDLNGFAAVVVDDRGWTRHVTPPCATAAEAVAAAERWSAGVGPLHGFGGRTQKAEAQLAEATA